MERLNQQLEIFFTTAPLISSSYDGIQLPLRQPSAAVPAVVPAAAPALPEVPLKFARKIRPEWSDAEIIYNSKIRTYRESDNNNRFQCDFKLCESPTTFWTAIRLKYNRNVPAKYRILLAISNDVEYALYDWAQIPKSEWIPFPSILPAFYTHPGKIYIQVDIPAILGSKDNIHVVLDVLGYTNLLPAHPRWDLKDAAGNRILTWIPSRDTGAQNDARLYHHLYDGEPPFEPNMEILPSPV